MQRLALRIITKGALLHAGLAPYPTMAGERVFDSDRTNINDLSADKEGPAILIRTDADARDMQGPGARPASHVLLRTCEMRIQFAFWGPRSTPDPQNPSGPPIQLNPWPVTDARLEAMLDLFEYQIEAALMGSHPYAAWWRQRFQMQGFASTQAFVEDEEGRHKLASRELVMNVVLPSECIPSAERLEEVPSTPALPVELKKVFDRINIDGTGDFKAYAAGLKTMLLSDYLPTGYQYPALNIVKMQIPEPNTPQGQTPRIDMEAYLLQKTSTVEGGQV